MQIDEIRNPLCTRCKLHENAKTICVMGNGDHTRKIMVIGEAPGATEDTVGEPFQGKTGKRLDEALGAAGIDRPSVYVTNIVKCRPPDNRRPKPEESAQCLLYLTREIRVINPVAVLLLGNSTLHVLTRIPHGISIARGRVPDDKHVFGKNVIVYATYHPSATLYSRDTKDVFFKDVAAFARLVEVRTPTTDESPLKG